MKVYTIVLLSACNSALVDVPCPAAVFQDNVPPAVTALSNVTATFSRLLATTDVTFATVTEESIETVFVTSDTA